MFRDVDFVVGVILKELLFLREINGISGCYFENFFIGFLWWLNLREYDEF